MAEEPNNPLFEDEREFLERKKLEYERALRGDVDQIKDKSMQVGKMALVGAGLAGSIWLISKAFGGKSKDKHQNKKTKDDPTGSKKSKRHKDAYYDSTLDDGFELDDEDFALNRSAEVNGDEDGFGSSTYDAPYGNAHGSKSARESAQVFQTYGGQPNAHNNNAAGQHGQPQDDDIDHQNFGTGVDQPVAQNKLPHGRLDFDPAVPLHKQGSNPAQAQSLAYDDSRRLPESTEFADHAGREYPRQDYKADTTWPKPRRSNTFGKQAGAALLSFLETTTGKAVAAQVAAIVLAYVTKKMNDLLPAAPTETTTGKNADLATVPATPSFYPAMPQPAKLNPAVSLTYPDAPTEHPTS